MSKKELARLRTQALHTGAADPIVEAFDAGHKLNAKQARLARKKAKLAAAAVVAEPVAEPVTEAEPEWSPLAAESMPADAVAELEAPVVEAVVETPETPVIETVTTTATVSVPFARAHLSWMKANLQLTAETRAALDGVPAKVFGKAIFLALPEAVQAELVAARATVPVAA